jgi:hypothetical protein
LLFHHRLSSPMGTPGELPLRSPLIFVEYSKPGIVHAWSTNFKALPQIILRRVWSQLDSWAGLLWVSQIRSASGLSMFFFLGMLFVFQISVKL